MGNHEFCTECGVSDFHRSVPCDPTQKAEYQREKNMYKQFIMEKRRSDGSLDLSEPQPPYLTCTEDQICQYYFRNTPSDAPSASLDEIREWYKKQGFSWRVKTW